MTSTQNSGDGRWSQRAAVGLFVPVDISFLVVFRVVIGAAVLWTVWGYLQYDLGASLATRPFRFTYIGFAWVQPWSTNGMYVHFGALVLFAVLLACGFLYRLSAVVLILGFAYVFLLEKARYLNHDYLICLFLLLLIFLPGNRCWSVDAWLRPKIKSEMAPAWTLWLLRFQVGLPHLYGGFAKLNGDWLRGQPMQLWLSDSPWRFVLGMVAEEQWLATLFSWGGLLFDVGVVPLLLWRRTRPYAFAAAVVFHLMNAFMFDIGVFPWMMICATLVFYPPELARRLIRRADFLAAIVAPPKPSGSPPGRLAPRQKLVLAALLLYVGFHLLVPLRHLLYPGSVLWTEEGHRFAWQMMLRTKETGMQFVVSNPSTGQREPADIPRWLNDWQFNKMSRDPEMMREFAQFLREQYRQEGHRDVEVHVLALCSLNGRKPQLLIDPDVDLSRQPRTVVPNRWILPLTEPFRWEPWERVRGADGQSESPGL